MFPVQCAKLLPDKVHTEMIVPIDTLVCTLQTSQEDVPVILVGGGSALINSDTPIKGTSRVCRPQHYEVANAVGAITTKIISPTAC